MVLRRNMYFFCGIDDLYDFLQYLHECQIIRNHFGFWISNLQRIIDEGDFPGYGHFTWINLRFVFVQFDHLFTTVAHVDQFLSIYTVESFVRQRAKHLRIL